ncbi:MAG TPA: CfrBI family restriction endonuclease [Saprospiraceae bacterium]|nr:CfrBI family restriction endonuclease [Saprospiraceae bacterium]HRK82771.1 CfrBI family restriction endonuclease [Saprospiraceae bacterium]
MKESFSKYIPDLGLGMAKFSGNELLERVGSDVIRDVVTSILCGGNVRALTEGLTQRRIALSNAVLLTAYLRASKDIENFPSKFTQIIHHELTQTKLSPACKIFLQWYIGLTGKSIQNVLRGDKDQLNIYLTALEQAIANAVQSSQSHFGDLQMNVSVGDIHTTIGWQGILQVFTGIGAQTLAIRGSEKSMYGKLFEKLILGSLLSLLGFKMIDPHTSTLSKNVFWLSERGDKRESDATLLYKPGVGVRFDIGFIGPGNTEISLDKVSRFEREMQRGKKHHFMSTVIIVDRIGEGSRIVALAKNIDGEIVQMSMNHWVLEIARILHKRIGFKHDLLKMTDEETIRYIQDKMSQIEINAFASL